MTGPLAEGPAFVDTNVLVYAYDEQAGAKHLQARVLLGELTGNERLWISAQVLNELAAVLLRHRATPILPADKVLLILEEVQALGEVVPVTGGMSRAAVEGVQRHGLSFWDALIWVAARDHGIGRIYSEDFQHGQVLEGVQFLNPFLGE
jgi:predicted nucleic acid-binding protein